MHTAAELSLGLHAARLPSPFATAIARTRDDADLGALLGPTHSPRLVTVRCMRKTLHTLPPPVAAIALAATRHYRMRDVDNAVRKAGLDRRRLTAAQHWVLEQLTGGACSHRQLESRAGLAAFSTPEIRLAVKACWEGGQITYRNGSDSWHRELRQFSLTRLHYPDLAVEGDPETGQDELVRLYFQRYGPATLHDASWWSGLGQQRIAAALARLEVVRLRLPWARSVFYMLGREYAFYRAAGEADHATGVNYLAHEDVALKAYYESRPRYLGRLPARSVFNQIGEVLPTIVCDGRVVGLWHWDHHQRTVSHRHFPRAGLSVEVRAASRRHARGLRDRLLSGYQRQR